MRILSIQLDLLHKANESGWTPLTAAVKANQVEMVRYILQQGANPEAKNNLNQNAIQIAKQQKNQSLLYILYAYRDT